MKEKINPCNSMADEFGSLPQSRHMNPQRWISHIYSLVFIICLFEFWFTYLFIAVVLYLL